MYFTERKIYLVNNGVKLKQEKEHAVFFGKCCSSSVEDLQFTRPYTRLLICKATLGRHIKSMQLMSVKSNVMVVVKCDLKGT